MKTLFLAVCLACSAGPASAQPAQGPLPVAERVQTIVDKLLPALRITEKQQADMRAVYHDFYTALDALPRKEGKPDRSAVMRLVGERDDRLYKVLGDEQFVQLKETEIALQAKNRKPAPKEGGQ